jgi:hypothetical protein
VLLMSRNLDLFEWADTRPTATVIDAREKFLDREVAFIRSLMIGYRPPTSGGEIVDFAERRVRRSRSRPKSAGRESAA